MSLRFANRYFALVFGLLGGVPSDSALAQSPKPTGTFLTDTIEVGTPFSYAFSLLHDSETDVFFPDSTFDFSPFTLVDQEYFTTRTDTLGSLDSTIDRRVTFDVTTAQPLRLPVYLLAARDCTTTASYTQLDVYKRQVQARLRGILRTRITSQP